MINYDNLSDVYDNIGEYRLTATINLNWVT